MSIYDLIPSRFIKTSDLTTPINVVIDSVAKETVGDETKPVVKFRDGKEMVLNLTRIDAIVQLYGDDERSWRGKPIQLRAGTTRFQGKAVGCIEVHAPQQTGGRTSILPNDDDQDVPF